MPCCMLYVHLKELGCHIYVLCMNDVCMMMVDDGFGGCYLLGLFMGYFGIIGTIYGIFWDYFEIILGSYWICKPAHLGHTGIGARRDTYLI